MMQSKAIILGILYLSASLFAEGSWSLEDCLKQAKEKSLTLENAKLREQQALLSIKQTQISGLPTVSASIQNTLYDQPFVDGPKDHYRLNMGITGSYTLWDGGANGLGIEAGQISKEAAALSTRQTERNVQENVLNAFVNLLAANENLASAKKAVELAVAENEHYGKLFEAGMITKKDLTQSQSNVLQKKAAELTAELQVNTSKTTLRQLLELPETEEFQIVTPEIAYHSPDSLPALPPMTELKSQVMQNHPGLKSDSASVRAAHKNTEVASKGNSVTVSLGANASTGLQAWESDRYGRQLKYGYQHSLTLGIHIPIVDCGATENRVLMAQVSESQSELTMQENAKSLDNNIEKIYLNALSSDMQWQAALLQVQAEQEALAVAEEQRNAGALTYTDYLSQKNALERAETTLINAKYTSILSRKLIELYQGKLD